MDTIKINTLDVSTVAHIVTMADMLTTGPIAGDLIVRDFLPGAVWQTAGLHEPYTMGLPLVMKAATRDQALADVDTLAAYIGQTVTLTRIVTLAGTVTTKTCQAVMTAAIAPEVSPNSATAGVNVSVDLIFQNLTGSWA